MFAIICGFSGPLPRDSSGFAVRMNRNTTGMVTLAQEAYLGNKHALTMLMGQYQGKPL
jgi:hypothetical protein